MTRRLALAIVATLPFAALAQEPRTAAEASKFEKTSTSAEVVAFCEALAKKHPEAVQYSTYGKSHAGNDLPLLTLTKLKQNPKPTLLVFANIHAGEVDGKEAVLALARDFAADGKLLEKVRVLILPNVNPDGNDRFGDKNRPGQNGPAVAGTRENGQGLDLNRDFTKLESPEVRALTQVFTGYEPLLVIDCHTTNGSKHGFAITYDGPRHPTAAPELGAFAFGKLLPAVGKVMKETDNFDTFHYGTFSEGNTLWETYPALPRFGVQALALRGSVGILSESYTYAPFETRVKASKAFVKATLEYAGNHLDELRKAGAAARESRPRIALRTKTVAHDEKESIFVPAQSVEGAPARYEVQRLSKVEPTLEVERAAAYLIPAEFAAAADTLQRHGITVAEVREEITLDVEEEVVSEINRSEREFQKHKLVTVETKSRKGTVKAKPGMFLVRTAQPLGTLAAYLLEPRSEDGLTAWNAFDTGLAVGEPHPVRRVLPNQPVFTGSPRPVPELRKVNQPFTAEALKTGRSGLAGSPMADVTWLPDGEHWLQVKENKLWKVHARTGKAELFVDASNLRKSLDGLPGIKPDALARQLALPAYRFDPKHEGMLVQNGSGLYFAYRDGRKGVALGTGEFDIPTFSADGKWLAYVRKGDLYAAEVATGKPRRLTAEGEKPDILSGHADWVYEEEIFHRRGQAYWWSPDSRQVAFLRFDDAGVPKFALTHNEKTHSSVETIRYPKPGDPNPTVKIGVVDATREKPETTFLKLDGYKPEDTIIARVGWVPGDKPYPFAYVQNREQTWLDFVTWPDLNAGPVRLFRETTGAWVEDLGEPAWMKDGTFLIPSERGGHRHVYHLDKSGAVLHRPTSGPADVKSIVHFNADTGYVYVSCTRGTSTSIYGTEALADAEMRPAPGLRAADAGSITQRASFAPKGDLVVIHEGNDDTPSKARLRSIADGQNVRVLDSNPAYEREKYRFGNYERTRILTRDGYEMEAAITYPPDFHPCNRYPVWMLTYAGPHAPTIKDGWGGGRVFEQVLAAHGIVVLRVDPQSASGKGMVDAKVCFRQLGVKELQDLEDAVDWIGKKPWADTKRVGISGHSYGGYITAYALTHSKKFSAGIAGAPVTDWRLYDSIYTERYMGLPEENKAGYDKSSVVKAAKNLHGELLIVHGMVDDNVHAQNSLQLIDALQKAGKDFEVMVYPNDRHGIATTHYAQTQLKFILRTMGVKKPER